MLYILVIELGEVQSGGATTSLLVLLEYAVKGVLYIVVLHLVGTIFIGNWLVKSNIYSNLSK